MSSVGSVTRSNRGSTQSHYKDSLVLKILVIGDACVGKTSFVNRYVNGMFSKHYRGTIGVDFALKILDWNENEKLKVQLWDIAGQERFTYMTRVYYRDAHGCIIMFDLTNRSSFLNVVKWKRDFDSKCMLKERHIVPCVLLANKADVNHLRQVSQEEVQRMCDEFNFSNWTEISVKDNTLIEDAMKYLLQSIMEEDSPDSGFQNPKSDAINLNSIPVETKGFRMRCSSCSQ